MHPHLPCFSGPLLMTPALFYSYTNRKLGSRKSAEGGATKGDGWLILHWRMLPLDYVEFFVFLAALCVVGVWFRAAASAAISTDYFLAGTAAALVRGGRLLCRRQCLHRAFHRPGGRQLHPGRASGAGPVADHHRRSRHRLPVRAFPDPRPGGHRAAISGRAFRAGRAAGLRAADHLRQHHHLHGGGDVCRRPGAVGLLRLAAALVHHRHRAVCRRLGGLWRPQHRGLDGRAHRHRQDRRRDLADHPGAERP